MKPLSMTRFATLWSVECEFRRDGRNGIVTWEPLSTRAPADARPYCSSWDITFYDRTGNRQIEKVNCHRFNLSASPELWLVDGWWWEMAGGQVRWLEDRWVIERTGWRNSRAACQANAGWPAYQSGRLPERRRRWLGWKLREAWDWLRGKQ